LKKSATYNFTSTSITFLPHQNPGLWTPPWQDFWKEASGHDIMTFLCFHVCFRLLLFFERYKKHNRQKKSRVEISWVAMNLRKNETFSETSSDAKPDVVDYTTQNKLMKSKQFRNTVNLNELKSSFSNQNSTIRRARKIDLEYVSTQNLRMPLTVNNLGVAPRFQVFIAFEVAAIWRRCMEDVGELIKCRCIDIIHC